MSAAQAAVRHPAEARPPRAVAARAAAARRRTSTIPIPSSRKHPEKKSDSARATFTFSADEAGVTFACKLDNRPYKPCSSPKTVKVREGGHKFSIVATDEAGNAGKPDMWVWKFSNFFQTRPTNKG